MGVLDSYKYNVRTGIKPTPNSNYVAAKHTNEEEEGGGGGGGKSLLDQVIQGPQWGSDYNLKASERRARPPMINWNQPSPEITQTPQPNTNNGPVMQSTPMPPGYAQPAPKPITTPTPPGYVQPTPKLVPVPTPPASYSYPNQTQTQTQVQNPRGFNKLTRTNTSPTTPQSSFLQTTGLSAPSPLDTGLTPSQSQQIPWLQSGGSPFQPGDIPIWTPSDWINPSNPLPQEVVAPELSLTPSAGTGVDTGLLASIMANDTSTNPPMPVSQIDAYIQEQNRNKVTVPGWDARQQDYWDSQMGAIANYLKTMSPQAVAQQNAYAPNSFTGPNGQVVGQSAGLSPWQAQNAGYQGLTNQVIAPQGNYAPNSFTGPDGQVAGQPASAPLSTGNGTVGAGKDATGKEIDPWVQVQDPTTGVLHPRGLSLEEVTNTGAGNLKKGFDYRNNPGFKGQTVTLPDGTVLPQIAGYYITNGRYYPIDLNAVSTLFKKFSYGGGGGGGGGGGYTQRSGQNGWLANWNIGV